MDLSSLSERKNNELSQLGENSVQSAIADDRTAESDPKRKLLTKIRLRDRCKKFDKPVAELLQASLLR